MTAEKISGKEKWDLAHIDLNRSLEKEIHLMREILANLHQEELSLLECDKKSWASVMDDRSDFILQIKNEREERMSLTINLIKLAVLQEKLELLPAEEESSCDILSKLDQVIALSERINLQNCRNDALFEQSKEKKSLPLECAYPHPLHQKKVRRKPSVATKTDES